MYVKGYCFSPDGKLYRDAELCDYFSNIISHDGFRQQLLSANGRFSVVIQRESQIWIAVDRFRYFPIFYRQQGDFLSVSDDIDKLYETGEPKETDSESCIVFSGYGYVLGNKTLLKNIFQVQAGELIVYDGKNITASFYHQLVSKIQDIPFEDAKCQLKDIFQRMVQRMFCLIGKRPVILSLSGGLDSRFIAYLLKKHGKEEVICYSYGVKENNPEWQRSKTVAEKLQFKWLFIDYNRINDLDFYKKEKFIRFYQYVSQYVSKFGFMPYFATDYLVNDLKIAPDSILMTGDGGDFFSGSHLRSYMRNYHSAATVASDLQYIHCHLVKLYKKERALIRHIIQKEMIHTVPLFANIENWDLKERQAKYILNASKQWEYFGIETQFPLCDTELMDFFVSLPIEYRLNQRLYRNVLSELFSEFDISFPQETAVQEKIIVQQAKVYVKRIFPFLRRKPDLFQYDYFDFKRFSQPILNELQDYSDREILSSNGIFSEWYLMQVKGGNK
jgi:asparagine synthase (glutamine-hydrolysing)